MQRRHFLRLSAAALGGGAAAQRGLRPLAASTTSEGTAFPSVPDELGVQLYTLRRIFPGDFVGVLEALHRIGYRVVEFAGYQGRNPGVVRAVLDDVGLRAPSAHVSLEALEEDLDGVLEAARTIGHEYLVVPSLLPARRADLDGYRRVADALNALGERTRAAGIQLGYHNHDFEFETFGGAASGFDVLLERTEPALVAIELDLFWTVHAGADPLGYFERHPGRFHLFHVKDRTPAGEMVDVGAGAIDFGAIFARAEAAGLRYAIVEHDRPDDPLASVTRSHDHLVALRG